MTLYDWKFCRWSAPPPFNHENHAYIFEVFLDVKKYTLLKFAFFWKLCGNWGEGRNTVFLLLCWIGTKPERRSTHILSHWWSWLFCCSYILQPNWYFLFYVFVLLLFTCIITLLSYISLLICNGMFNLCIICGNCLEIYIDDMLEP